MTARRGGPPRKVAGGPDVATKTAEPNPYRKSSRACRVDEANRRRAASRRLALLDTGRADPWCYDEVPLTEHQLESWQRTVAHLTAAGYRAIIPAAMREVLR